MRKGWSYKIKLLILPLMALILMGGWWDCDDDGGDPGDYTEQPPDNCPYWDTDCDGISNAVETNSANSYLYLNPDLYDYNPTLARGKPCSTDCVGTECGWIEDALNMVNQGTGYYHYNPEKRSVDHDDWGTLALINMIEAAGRTWSDHNCVPPRINVGDLSWGDTSTLEFGGYFYPHICHQNGLEVDIRYVRNDGQDESLNVRTQPSLYDLPGTWP
jgi:hypothetical protein